MSYLRRIEFLSNLSLPDTAMLSSLHVVYTHTIPHVRHVIVALNPTRFSEARDMIRAGSLKTHKGAIGKLTAKGIDLQQSGEAGGGSIGCDLIVCGTGFSKSYDYLDTTSRSKLQLEKDGLYLYRSMIPVLRVPTPRPPQDPPLARRPSLLAPTLLHGVPYRLSCQASPFSAAKFPPSTTSSRTAFRRHG